MKIILLKLIFSKIDTEGYELEVLAGFKNLLNQKKIKTIYCAVGFNSNNTRNK